MLLGALSALLVFFGELLAPGQAPLFLGIALLGNFFMYFFSAKLILTMHGAKEIQREQDPKLYAIVAELARRAELPMPRIYIMESAQPNAFATGRNPQNGVVAVTTGLQHMLTERELRGVLAHELAHIKHRDILIATVAAMLATAVSHLASSARWSLMFSGGGREQDEEGHSSPVGLLVMAIVAPIVAFLIQMGISRSREYLADEGGARICGDPQALAAALRKLEQGVALYPTNAEPAMSNLFIASPFAGRGGLLALLSTHPPMEERIKRLQQMAQGLPY